jgi:hypothetical protein
VPINSSTTLKLPPVWNTVDQNLKRYKVTPITGSISGSGVAGLELRVNLVKLIDKLAYKRRIRVAYSHNPDEFKVWVYGYESDEPVGFVAVDRSNLDVRTGYLKYVADIDYIAYTFMSEVEWLLKLLVSSVVGDASKGS